MPLIQGYSDKTRSRNIAILRRDGYPPKQAAAIAYSVQRKARRRRGLRNPNLSDARTQVFTGAAIVGLAAMGGAVLEVGVDSIGAATSGGTVNVPADIVHGAAVAAGVTGIGGLAVALVDPKLKIAGFSAAGFALGGLVVYGLVNYAWGQIVGNTSNSSTSTPSSSTTSTPISTPTTPTTQPSSSSSSSSGGSSSNPNDSGGGGSSF